jgi:hypothetical protein
MVRRADGMIMALERAAKPYFYLKMAPFYGHVQGCEICCGKAVDWSPSLHNDATS